MTNDSYEIVANAIRKYWKQDYPQNVIAFFKQKYEFEDETEWEYVAEFASPYSWNDNEMVCFDDDFCEGQTCVKDLIVVPYSVVADYYYNNVLLKGEQNTGERRISNGSGCL